MRVFIGVKADWNIQAEIAAWQQHHQRIDMRWIPIEDLHITLVPPWEAAESDRDYILEQMRQCIDADFHTSLTFSRVESGPEPHSPRLLWARAEPVAQLVTLHERLMQTFNMPHDRAFIPHITIARAGTAKVPHLYEAVTWKCDVDNVTLFRTVGGGAGYTVLGQMRL